MDATKRHNSTVTDKQLEVLIRIDAGCREDRLGRSPTLRRIAVSLGIAKSTVYQHIEALKEKGLVDGEPWCQRAVTVTDAGRDLLKAAYERTSP